MSKSNYYKERVIQLLLFFAFMLPMGALAQNIQLNGTVTDVSGESVIGASVLEKGTTNGVITDIDGNFTLSVSPKATIIISYVGYAPQEIALNGRKELKVVLKEEHRTTGRSSRYRLWHTKEIGCFRFGKFRIGR